MSDTLSQIGTFLSSNAGKGLLTAGTAGGGLIQNFLANRQANQKQRFVQDLITNPAKFNQFVQGFDQPLSKGLTSEVARETDAYGATRGLGSSPAVMQDVFAQALAPSVMAEKNAAIQAALQSLGIYEDSPTQRPIDVTGALKAIQMLGGKGGRGSNPSIDPTAQLLNTGYNVPDVAYPGALPDPSIASDIPAITGQ
jgi:hypothetical protein